MEAVPFLTGRQAGVGSSAAVSSRETPGLVVRSRGRGATAIRAERLAGELWDGYRKLGSGPGGTQPKQRRWG